jgi:hypothetical protein
MPAERAQRIKTMVAPKFLALRWLEASLRTLRVLGVLCDKAFFSNVVPPW